MVVFQFEMVLERHKMRILIFTICCITLFFGCSSDEDPEQTTFKSNYFPNTVGTRWVYRTPEGLLWTWLVTDEITPNSILFQKIEYTPEMTGNVLDLIIPSSFRVTQDQVFITVDERINNYLQNGLPKVVDDEFTGLEIRVNSDTESYPELLFLQTPLTLNSQWDALDTNITGNLILQDLVLLQFEFDVQISISGKILDKNVIQTPAGTFENAFQLQYEIDITHLVLSNEETVNNTQLIWFVPHVGIVKIEDDEGITELIEYHLQPSVQEM